MRIEIYVDGSCEPNPGEMGYAAVLVALDDEGNLLKRIVRTGYKASGTNNQAEICAAIIGLQSLTKPTEVTVYSDSQYLVNVMNDAWKSDKNRDEFRVLRLATMQHTVRWQWVKGHNGNEFNEMAHNAAQLAIRYRGKSPVANMRERLAELE
jgi:ribonuclease HI